MYLGITMYADAAQLLIRIAAALAFLFHGSGILFGLFGGPGDGQFAATMHFAVVMLGAIVLVHLPHGFAIRKGGIECPLTQFRIA
jgi:uncharacterized membrane protein YphA (DoxX/SURF4 family)